MNLNFSSFKIWALAVLAVFGTVSGRAQPAGRGGSKDFSAFQIINDRNIFDPARRPRVQQTRTAPRPQQIVDSFSLVGTMSYSNLLLAFFDGTSSDYRRSLAVGGKIAGYTNAEISHNFVKLVMGTNEIILKVGMQMRRSEDGSWTATEQMANSYVSNGGDRHSGSNDRRTGNLVRNGRPSATVSQQPNDTSSVDPGIILPVPDISNLDTNDPVARLMLRRMQEEGGPPPVLNDAPPPENPPGENPDTNSNAGPVQNIPNAQPER